MRVWKKELPTLGVIMLNPSIADAEIDDPTIRRVCDFADRWGYGRIIVGNLYAAVSTDPNKLKEMKDPIGPHNNAFLEFMKTISAKIIAGWGTKANENRVREVVAFMKPLFAFKLTKKGHPSHPLYLPKTIEPVQYKA
jgi:hypothetical protein